MKYTDSYVTTNQEAYSPQELHDWEEFTKLATGKKWSFTGGHTPPGYAYDVSGSVRDNPVVIELKERRQEFDSYMIEMDRVNKILIKLLELASRGIFATPVYVNIIKGKRKAVVFDLLKCKDDLVPRKKPRSKNIGYTDENGQPVYDDNNYAYFLPAWKAKVHTY